MQTFSSVVTHNTKNTTPETVELSTDSVELINDDSVTTSKPVKRHRYDSKKDESSSHHESEKLTRITSTETDNSLKQDEKPQKNVFPKIMEEMRKDDDEKSTTEQPDDPTKKKKSTKNSAASNESKFFVLFTTVCVFIVANCM